MRIRASPVGEQLHDGGKQLVVVVGIDDQSVVAVGDELFRRPKCSDTWS
jgi:hypothetical protein